MGQIAPCGTGETDIILDESKLPNPESDEDDLEDIETWEQDMDEDYCDINIGFNYNADAIEADNIENIPEL